jgi:ABC-2 type transport system permease protein
MRCVVPRSLVAPRWRGDQGPRSGPPAGRTDEGWKFGQLLDLPGWIQDLSPFQHVPSYPASDLHALPLAVLVAIAAGLAALGLVGFRRRDLG